MSFDIFLQDFSAESADRSREILPLLAPLLDGGEIITTDGSAYVYGIEDPPITGLMFTHVVGDAAWDVIFEAALTANWIVLVDGKVLIVNDGQRGTIPEDLAEAPTMLVRSGTEL
ncbi:MAG: hypothetical protein ABUL47_05170 [Leifsonia sp.]